MSLPLSSHAGPSRTTAPEPTPEDTPAAFTSPKIAQQKSGSLTKLPKLQNIIADLLLGLKHK
jgi:hypothetical protein